MADERGVGGGKSGVPRDPNRFEVPVAGLGPDDLSERLRASLKIIAPLWPEGTGLTLFAFDFGERGGLTYISNADRAGMIATVREWLNRQEAL